MKINKTKLKAGLLAITLLAGLGTLTTITLAQENIQSTTSVAIGFIDGITVPALPSDSTTIIGWAADGYIPTAEMEVFISTDREGLNIVGNTIANIARPDVEEVFIAPLAGWAWEVPRNFYDGNTHQFHAWARSTDSSIIRSLTYIGAVTQEPIDNGFTGAIDTLEDNIISGWAIDLDGQDIQNQQIPIFIYIDGQFIGSTKTGLERTDVGAAFLKYNAGNNQGWNIMLDIPNRLRDNKEHRIEVFALEYTQGEITKIGEPIFKYINTDGLIQNQTPQK